MSSPKTKKLDKVVFDEATGKKMMNAAIGVLAVGVLLGGAAWKADPKHFAFSYLTGFATVATVGLGALFFIIIQYLTKAGWSVIPRRAMEWVSGILPATAILFLPIIAFSHDLFHHWMSEEAHHDPILQKKAAYLNTNFFYIRAVVFFVVWTGLSLFYWQNSRKQDESGDPALTVKMQNMAPPATLLFGLSLTFAAFDWLMSLDPHWYSTIFGVYIFAGGATSSLAALALLAVRMEKKGMLQGIITVEHRHDIGKLLFGFTVFWAYIAFSQFILIWYANIPEETIFYKHRWEGSWAVVSILLLAGHFIVPFLALISRDAKRSPQMLAAVAVLMLVMHYVDIYWLVMPNFAEHGAEPSWIDLAGLLGPLGAGALALAMRAKSSPLYPLRDPRLVESLKLENL
ncbi:MAG: hypothetical protein QM820_30900 [Minicystis sp.]